MKGIARSQKEILSFYENPETASVYDKERLKSERKRVFRRIESYWATKFLTKPGKILEVGVGTGFISKELCEYGELTGIDSSGEMLSIARKKLKGKKVKLKKKDLFEFKEGPKFDFLVSFRVLLHFDDENLVKALDVFSRNLKTGGFAIFDVESRSLLKKIIACFRVMLGKGKEAQAPQHSREDILMLISSVSGLRVEKIIAMDHLALFLPLYIANNFLKFETLSNFLFNIDIRMKNVHIGNTRWVVLCKKK